MIGTEKYDELEKYNEKSSKNNGIISSHTAIIPAIVRKSIVPKTLKVYTVPIKNPISPIRFINIALIAALFACIRVYQKLINKKEQIPTPSHPKNNCNKFPALTKINIKKVNSDI